MNIAEQNLYLNATKSSVECFESFVDSLNKHGDILSDAELINKMKRISKKLQTVINKWDAKLVKFTSVDGTDSNSDIPTKIISEASSNEEETKAECSKETTNSKDESVMLTFKDIDKTLILGPDGYYIEEISPGFWKCNICNAINLPLNNLLSHINGRSHKKKTNFSTNN